MARKQTLLVIDGSGLAFKSNPRPTDEKPLGYFLEGGGFVHTGLQYGFMKGLLHLNKEFSPDAMVVCWEGGWDRRLKIFPDYKRSRAVAHAEAVRQEAALVEERGSEKGFIPPHNFRVELPRLYEMTDMLGIQQFQTPGEEGDDLIGTIVRLCHKRYRIVVVSNDHDFKQCLKYDDVSTYFSLGFRKIKHTRREFVKKHGFHPKYHVNMMALTGDPTDEYPGVPGIGEVRAMRLVSEYGPRLDSIFEKARKGKIEIRGIKRINELLLENEATVWMNRRLASLHNVELRERRSKWMPKKLMRYFAEHRFHSFTSRPERFAEVERLPRKRLEL